MTKRNRRSKAGAQNTKAITEFSKELATNPANKKVEKTRPH